MTREEFLQVLANTCSNFDKESAASADYPDVLPSEEDWWEQFVAYVGLEN